MSHYCGGISWEFPYSCTLKKSQPFNSISTQNRNTRVNSTHSSGVMQRIMPALKLGIRKRNMLRVAARGIHKQVVVTV